MGYLSEGDIISRLESIDELPALPDMVIKLNSILHSPDFCIKEVATIIEKDQSMVSKLLKIVNSAFFGMSTPISNIKHAIVILGLNTVRNALLTSSVIDGMADVGNIEGFDKKDFWLHSISVAVMSRHLSYRAKIQFPDDCFTAGLLHDMGKLILAEYFKDEFMEILKRMKEDGLDFFNAEEKVMEKGHDFLGAYLARRWNLPENLINTIRFHHEPFYVDENNSLVLLIYLSDYLIYNLKRGDMKIPELSSLKTEDAKRLIRELNLISEWIEDVLKDVDSACRLLME